MPSLPYVVRRGLWMVHSALQLIAALGTGIYWIVQLYRLTLYSFLMLFYFLPHAWWYLTSPSVIRRVRYRKECNDSMTDDNHMQSSRSSESNSTSWEKGTPISSSSSVTSMHDCGAAQCSQSRHRHLDIAPMFLSRIFTSSAAKTSTAQIPKMKNKNARKYYDTFNKPKGGVESKDMKNEKGRSIENRNSDVHPSSSQCPSDTRGTRASSPRQQTTHYRRDDAPSSSPHHALPHCTGVACASSGAYNDWDDYNRATLDVVLPVPFDVVMKALEDKNQRRRTHRHHLQRKKFPIVILFTGGAWIIGSQMWSTMLARVLASRGYVVFCPDYRNFPQATMEGMTLDVSDAIAWVLRNAERYNGDLQDVTLLGQSAGAHLTMMSLLSQAQWFGFKAKGGKPSSLSPPSSVAYNVPRYNPRASIRRYIGLSGFYNIEAQATHFHQKGLNRSLLHKIAGGKENMPRYSLNSYFDPCRQGDTGEVLPDNIFDFLPPKMYYLHGDADETSPAQDCSTFVMAVKSTQYAFLLERTKTLAERRAHEKRSSKILPGYILDPFVLTKPEQGSPRGQELSVGENGGRRKKGGRKRTSFSAVVLSSDHVLTSHNECVPLWHADNPVKEEKKKQRREEDVKVKREGRRERGNRKSSERKRTMTPTALLSCTASTREGVNEEGMGKRRSVDGDERIARSHGGTSSPVNVVEKMRTQGKERKREEKRPQRKLRTRFPSSSSLSSFSSPFSWPAMTKGHASNSFPPTQRIKTMTTAITARPWTSPRSMMESPLYAVSPAPDGTPSPHRSHSTHLQKSVRQRSTPQPSSAWLSVPPTAPPPSIFSASIVHTTSELYTLPCTPCEIRFLIIPGSRHTDPLVEECLCAGRSCCADFLCDYDEFDFPPDPTTALWDSSTPAVMKGLPSLKGNGDDTAVANKMMGMTKHGSSSRRTTSSGSHSDSPFAPFITREYLTPRNRRAAPDGFLPLAVSFNERGMLMKWCSSVCPF